MKIITTFCAKIQIEGLKNRYVCRHLYRTVYSDSCFQYRTGYTVLCKQFSAHFSLMIIFQDLPKRAVGLYSIKSRLLLLVLFECSELLVTLNFKLPKYNNYNSHKESWMSQFCTGYSTSSDFGCSIFRPDSTCLSS